MFPHADTIYTINTLDYPQRLRLAARERLAAGAQQRARSPLTMPTAAQRIAVVWLDEVRPRLASVHRVLRSRELSPDATRATHPVS
jgi:hypothetical protein